MNRIVGAFQKKKVFIPFITAAYPDPDRFVDIVVALAKRGAGIIEIGIPFSDPVADGKVIQAASQRVLENGFKVDDLFELMRRIREQTDVPIIWMSYYNILLSKGLSTFVKQAVQCGVDGLIVPDLVPEEAVELSAACKDKLALTFLICSTTTEERIRLIAQKSTGFVYYVSRLGVTGMGGLDTKEIESRVTRLRQQVKQPIALGFGISNAKEAKEVYGIADGVIIGSALIHEIDAGAQSEDIVKRVIAFADQFIVQG